MSNHLSQVSLQMVKMGRHPSAEFENPFIHTKAELRRDSHELQSSPALLELTNVLVPPAHRDTPILVPASVRGHMAGDERILSQWGGDAGCWRYQDCAVCHCPAGRAPRVCVDAVHIPDRLLPGAFGQVLWQGGSRGAWGCVMCAICLDPGSGAGPVCSDPHTGPGVPNLPGSRWGACSGCQG